MVRASGAVGTHIAHSFASHLRYSGPCVWFTVSVLKTQINLKWAWLRTSGAPGLLILAFSYVYTLAVSALVYAMALVVPGKFYGMSVFAVTMAAVSYANVVRRCRCLACRLTTIA